MKKYLFVSTCRQQLLKEFIDEKLKVIKMSQKRIRFRRCPYCGKKLNYFGALKNVRKGEYTCKKCKKYSNIKFSFLVFLLLLIVIAASYYFAFILYDQTVKGIVLAVVPFILMRFLIPFFIKLIPVKMVKVSYDTVEDNNKEKKKKKTKKQTKTYVPKTSKYNNEPSDGEDDGKTRYIPSLK